MYCANCVKKEKESRDLRFIRNCLLVGIALCLQTAIITVGILWYTTARSDSMSFSTAEKDSLEIALKKSYMDARTLRWGGYLEGRYDPAVKNIPDSATLSAEKIKVDSIYRLGTLVEVLQSPALHSIIRYGDYLKSDSALLVRWTQLREQKPDSITAHIDSIKLATLYRINKLCADHITF